MRVHVLRLAFVESLPPVFFDHVIRRFLEFKVELYYRCQRRRKRKIKRKRK